MKLYIVKIRNERMLRTQLQINNFYAKNGFLPQIELTLYISDEELKLQIENDLNNQNINK